MKKLSLVLLLIISFTSFAYANTAKPWWVNIGTGIVYGNDTTDNCARLYPSLVIEDRCRNIRSNKFWNGDNFIISYNLMPKDHRLFTVNYTEADYEKSVSSSFGTVNETGYINAISVEYGLIQRWHSGYLSGTIGPAFVSSRSAHDNRELFPPSSHSGAGLSGKVEASMIPFRYVGFALSLIGNYNGNMPYYGIFLSLQFGKFW
jgi:hypothetical protein